METVVLGCGEAFDERLPNTSLLIDFGEKLLVDCGFSMPPRLWEEAPGPDLLDAIYISHGHADHYFGLPALLTRMWEEQRTKPLILVSQAEVLERIPRQVELAYPGIAARFRFAIEYREAAPDKEVAIGGARLRFAWTRHAAPNCALRVEAGGKAVCYSGDGMFTEESRALFRGADLLFHEAYGFEPGEVHGEIGAVIAMAAGEKVKRLGLVHVNRKVRREADRLTAAVREGGERVTLPEPGSRYTV